MAAEDITVTIKGPFMRNELAALLSLLTRINVRRDGRHWTIMVEDPGSTMAEAEELMRAYMPDVTTYRRQ